jgi:hypothetical protein
MEEDLKTDVAVVGTIESKNKKMKNLETVQEIHLPQARAMESTTEQQMELIQKQIKEYRDFMNGKSFEFDLQMAFENKIAKLHNQFWALKRPELKDQTCGICQKKYDGFGNNPYPINLDRCCDDCNVKYVIPRRFDCLSREDFEKYKVNQAKSQKKRK